MTERSSLMARSLGQDPVIGSIHDVEGARTVGLQPGIWNRAPIDHTSFATARRIPAGDTSVDTKIGGQSSLALGNMRALVILVVLAFHSVLAYLGSLGPASFPFDEAPYKWRAFPIVDSHRWYGFDIFCAWQDVYLMSLMFFLSALFTWSSLARKGPGKFLADRFLRLGVPFAFALIVILPVALYPAYRVTAVDPSLAAYTRHLLALPFWPNGPMWFLWQLLALTIVAAALYRFAPHWVAFLGRCSSTADTRPGRYFLGLVTASALAYVPLALIFTPWDWSNHGPFAIQLSRPLHYAVYYLAGLGVGAFGFERGLLAAGGSLARRWGAWLGLALASLMLWMGLTALAMTFPASAPASLLIAVDISFVLACASGCFFVIAGCLRFGTHRSRILANLADKSFGLYLFHYVFVVWLQYILLGVALFAIAKAMIVFGGTLILAWTATTVMRFVPFGSLLLGAERRRSPDQRSARATSALVHQPGRDPRDFHLRTLLDGNMKPRGQMPHVINR
jgi:glucans biosynthesis protein C